MAPKSKWTDRFFTAVAVWPSPALYTRERSLGVRKSSPLPPGWPCGWMSFDAARIVMLKRPMHRPPRPAMPERSDHSPVLSHFPGSRSRNPGDAVVTTICLLAIREAKKYKFSLGIGGWRRGYGEGGSCAFAYVPFPPMHTGALAGGGAGAAEEDRILLPVFFPSPAHQSFGGCGRGGSRASAYILSLACTPMLWRVAVQPQQRRIACFCVHSFPFLHSGASPRATMGCGQPDAPSEV